jgi:hypothetical protein
MKNANGGIGWRCCMQRKSHLSGDTAQPCALRHGAHDLSNQQYGRLLPVDSGHEKLRLHVSMAGSPRRRTSSHCYPETTSLCRLAQQKPLPFSYPVRRQAYMHTNLPRLEKEKDVELSWEGCSFSLSRFAILSGAKEE